MESKVSKFQSAGFKVQNAGRHQKSLFSGWAAGRSLRLAEQPKAAVPT